MANAYTPGLKVTPKMTFRARRVLPIPGDVLVKVGQKVKATDVVAQTFMPGDVTPINMANLLAMPPGDVPACMLIQEGQRVNVGDVLARTPGLFGMFKKDVPSKVAGAVETISPVTGQVIIRGEPQPVQVIAYLAGTVVEVLPREGVVIEAEVAFIQGIFGIGGETFGPIRMACKSHKQELTEDLISEDMKGAVIVGGARMHYTAVKKAMRIGVAAIVSGGIDDSDLKEVLGYDLGVAITGSERIGLTLIVTEGFGDIAMAQRSFALLDAHQGHEAAVNGATQIRAGVMRPEVVIPLAATAADKTAGQRNVAGLLEVGTMVRIIRDPYFGLIGAVKGLPPEPAVLGSGSKARVLEVRFDSGETVTVPRANVELIES